MPAKGGSRARAAILVVLACAAVTPARAGASTGASVKWGAYWQFLMSAFRVDTSQRSTVGDQESAAVVSAMQASSQAIDQQQIAASIVDARSRYAYESGQGYRSCMVAPGVAAIGGAASQRVVYARSLMARDDAWFDGGGDARTSLTGVLGLRRSVYCSSGEQAALGGWCDPALARGRGGYPAGNSDAGVFLFNRGYGAEEAMTGLDYIDTVAPLPTVVRRDSWRDREVGGARVRAMHAGAFVAAARTGIEQVILDGLQDTRPVRPSVAAGGQP